VIRERSRKWRVGPRQSPPQGSEWARATFLHVTAWEKGGSGRPHASAQCVPLSAKKPPFPNNDAFTIVRCQAENGRGSRTSCCTARRPATMPAIYCSLPFSCALVSMRVLIIDDDRDVSHLMSLLVDHFGHEAKTLTVPQAAVEIAKSWQPELVLLDPAMTGMDVYKVAKQLREYAGLSTARIITLSALERDHDKEKAAGINGHYVKPLTAWQLAELLDGPRP
jgi:CheY-like chemotaxis protein